MCAGVHLLWGLTRRHPAQQAGAAQSVPARLRSASSGAALTRCALQAAPRAAHPPPTAGWTALHSRWRWRTPQSCCGPSLGQLGGWLGGWLGMHCSHSSVPSQYLQVGRTCRCCLGSWADGVCHLGSIPQLPFACQPLAQAVLLLFVLTIGAGPPPAVSPGLWRRTAGTRRCGAPSCAPMRCKPSPPLRTKVPPRAGAASTALG